MSKITNLSLIDQHTYKGVKWYHEQERDSDNLLIAVGDSWTWGDSLGKSRAGEIDDYKHRTSHVYGNVISEKLDFDFINIGMPGYSNLVILERFEQVLSSIVKPYKRIYVIVTLTESGRDLLEPFISRKKQYNEIKNSDWPDFEDIILGKEFNFSVPAIYSNSHRFEPGQTTHMQHSLELHIELANASSSGLISILNRSEKFVVDKFQKILDRANITYRIGRCFTNWTNHYDSDNILSNIWTDIIANKGELPPYPDQVYVMSQIGMEPLLEWINLMELNFKDELDKLMSRSLLAIDWLKHSPYNSQIATRHPKEQAHCWWGEYILDSLKYTIQNNEKNYIPFV